MSYQTHEPCTACGDFYAQRCLHHIKTRKSGGSDQPFNLMPLCLKHHTEVHAIGLMKFSQKYKAVRSWLLAMGWEVDQFLNKWVHPRSNDETMELD